MGIESCSPVVCCLGKDWDSKEQWISGSAFNNPQGGKTACVRTAVDGEEAAAKSCMGGRFLDHELGTGHSENSQADHFE